MMWEEQYRIIKYWTYRFSAQRGKDGMHKGHIAHSKYALGAEDSTRACYLHHNMIDDAFALVRINVQRIIREIEAEKK